MAQNQRERLIAGLTEILYEEGYQKTTVSLIGQRAAVSKSDFYKHFDSKDECFNAAYDVAIARIRECVEGACREYEHGAWASRVQAAVAALLGLLAAEPALASMVLVEGLRAGRGIYDRYQAALESFVPALREGAPRALDGNTVPEAMDEAVVGGVASLLARRVLGDEGERLDELLPEVLEFILAPYLGTAEARRIISAG